MADCDVLVETVRVRLGTAVRQLLTGQARPAPARFGSTGDDVGLFGPGSAAWQVHADLATVVGGVRALLLQTLHPLAMAAVADHSDYRRDPLGRLHRTAGFLGATVFGRTPAADEAIARVRTIHRRVVGQAPDGRPYRADDPRLLEWIHVTEVDSFLAAHQRYGRRPLDEAGADRYVAEMAVVGRRLGAVDPPTTVAGARASIERFRPELAAGRQAHEAVRFLLWPPLPLPARAPHALIAAAAIGLLPGWAARALWLPRAPGADTVVVRPACLALLRVLGWSLQPPSSAAA
ncbi:MAG: DUF2236 domain-containing protein [Actinobacteria bacterium]|nr:DUF2236 domain-containing protein [Actinomycetota bacterium]